MAEGMSTKDRRKAIALEKDRIELDQERARLELAKLKLDREQRLFRDLYDYSPHERGEFHLSGVIDQKSCSYLLKDVDRFAYFNDGAPIKITFETPGGAVTPGLGLFDSLRAIAGAGHRLTTVIRGYAASMGAVLLQAGDVRLVGPESMFMLHEISSMTMGKLFEMEEDVKLTRTLNTKLFDIVARRTDGLYTGAKLYAKVKTHDWWLTAEETVANKFADDIG